MNMDTWSVENFEYGFVNLAIKYSLFYYKQHYTIHYLYQSLLPIIVSFKGSCKHAKRTVETGVQQTSSQILKITIAGISSPSRGKLRPFPW